jgi:hypothetical protein
MVCAPVCEGCTIGSPERGRRKATSASGALAAVDVKDFARHKAGRFQIEDRIDDVGDLADTANRAPATFCSMPIVNLLICF